MISKHGTCNIQSGYSADKITYYITIVDIICQENWFTKINNIVKALVKESELFFGFYRIDGLTLTKREWDKYDKEIPLFFKENGEYKEIMERIIDRKGKVKEYKGYLAVAKTKITGQFYDYLKWILQFYLETIFFAPKVSFDEFETNYIDYIRSPRNDYIVKGYTDFLFSYYDSGSFSISFDPKKHDADKVLNIINSAFLIG